MKKNIVYSLILVSVFAIALEKSETPDVDFEAKSLKKDIDAYKTKFKSAVTTSSQTIQEDLAEIKQKLKNLKAKVKNNTNAKLQELDETIKNIDADIKDLK